MRLKFIPALVSIAILMACSDIKRHLMPYKIDEMQIEDSSLVVYNFKVFNIDEKIEVLKINGFPANVFSMRKCEDCQLVKWMPLINYPAKEAVLAKIKGENEHAKIAVITHLLNEVQKRESRFYFACYTSNEFDGSLFYEYFYLLDLENQKIYEFDYNEDS